ncbi:MAG: hypothetical protein JWM40_2733, partial [Frankiales bacterium]|nr:hypothetical protein [Frankiales bacterium]
VALWLCGVRPSGYVVRSVRLDAEDAAEATIAA